MKAVEVSRLGTQAWTKYRSETSPRIQLLDLYIAFNLLLAALQFAYEKLSGSFPFNSFLAGFYCCVGAAALAVALRVHITDKDERKSEERIIGEWLICNLLLFLTVFNYLG
jgi:oligosaccharyltransferase complex subunit epsilon